MLIRVVDFETTGLPTDAGGAFICETAYCDVRYHKNVARVDGAPKSFLCDPGIPMPVLARAVHHINDEDVRGAMTDREALEAIIPPAPEDTSVFYCAHNADFERNFFAPGSPWICTYKVAVRLWPDSPSHSNQALRYYLNLDLDRKLASPPHRAGPDAYVTAHLLAVAINDGRATIDEMHRWSDGPALLPRINFGKHKGMRWEDAPVEYLDWIANKSDMDRDAKANARHHLKRRIAA